MKAVAAGLAPRVPLLVSMQQSGRCAAVAVELAWRLRDFAGITLLGAADGAYEATRRITGLRLRVSDAGLGAIALREAALGGAGPSARVVPGFGALVAFALQMIPKALAREVRPVNAAS